jgi:hypothetical protein
MAIRFALITLLGLLVTEDDLVKPFHLTSACVVVSLLQILESLILMDANLIQNVVDDLPTCPGINMRTGYPWSDLVMGAT